VILIRSPVNYRVLLLQATAETYRRWFLSERMTEHRYRCLAMNRLSLLDDNDHWTHKARPDQNSVLYTQ